MASTDVRLASIPRERPSDPPPGTDAGRSSTASTPCPGLTAARPRIDRRVAGGGIPPPGTKFPRRIPGVGDPPDRTRRQCAWSLPSPATPPQGGHEKGGPERPPSPFPRTCQIALLG